MLITDLLIVFNACVFSLSCNCILTVVKYTDMLCYAMLCYVKKRIYENTKTAPITETN